MGDRLPVQNSEVLRTWLTSTLEPICDADPAALAKYVMALLKKDKPIPDLRDFCVEQLDVFLQSETEGFVDRVFEAVRSGTYAPEQATSSAAESIPLEAPSTPTKDDSSTPTTSSKTGEVWRTQPPGRERDGRRSRSRERLARHQRSPEAKRPEVKRRSRSRSRSRSPRDRRRGAAILGPDLAGGGGGRNGREDRRRDDRGRERRRSRSPRSPGKERSGILQRSKAERERGGSPPRPLMEIKTDSPHRLPPPGIEVADELDAAIKERRKAKKQRCRDYDEKGFCMRGDRCPYDHGPDPVIVEDTQLPNMIVGTKASAVPYGITPGSNPPPPGVDSYAPTASSSAPVVGTITVTEAYNPEAPAIASAPMEPKPNAYPPYPPPPLPPGWSTQPPPNVLQPPFPRYPPPPPAYPPFPPPNFPPHMDQTNLRQLTDPGMSQGRPRGNLGQRMGPRPAQSYRPPIPDNKTLEIRKVPPQLNSIVKLNEHFQSFGQIINIQVRYDGDPEAALITFATRPQALNAYKSTSPILNNRFIKVFWHNPEKAEDGTGGASAPPANPAPSKIPTDRQAFKKVNTVRDSVSGEKGREEEKTAPAPTPYFGREDALARRQAKKREKEKKLAFLALHKKKTELLSKQMDSQKAVVAEMEKAQGNPAKMKELMKLFRELDGNNKKLTKEVAELAEKLKGMANATGGVGNVRTKEQLEREKLDVELELDKASKDGADTTPLQQKLADIRNELVGQPGPKAAAATRVPEALGPRRRRSSEAGGPPLKRQRSLMMSDKKLDKRPKNLLVVGFTEEQREAVVKHMESFGEVLDLEVDNRGEGTAPRVQVTYKTRQQAETALELAEDFQGVEKSLKVTWGPSQRSAAAPSSSAESLQSPPRVVKVEAAPSPPPAPVINRHMSAEEMLKSIDNPSDSDEDAVLNEPEIA